ncbi:MAG: (Fe-S)-binding protein [Planctomycetes bacterium]|nr:(Fe-S)-binding protein [Planctomycetota bacterium]
MELLDKKCEFNIEEYDLSDRPRRFLEAFAAILQHSNYGFVLDHYARIGMKCSQCASTCPIYERTGNPDDMPCQRSEMLLRIYRRYFTLGGRLKARMWNGYALTDDEIDKMAESFWRCTACRRCKLSCPMGIDHGLITHLARWIMSEIGIAPRALVVSVREQLTGKTRNTSAIPVPALKDSCEFLEEELVDEFGIVAKFPFDVEGAEYLFAPAVSDFMMEAETLMGNAAVMAATQASWTLGTQNYDAINYGLFYNDRMLGRVIRQLVAEVRRLNAKKILIGECGHASRSAKFFVPTYGGGKDAPPVINCMEYAHEMWQQGKLKLKAGAIKEKVTYHDPCNIARTGWILDQPRELLKAICADYVEMTPNRAENYCCGGGGGSVSIDEIREWRTSISGTRKAEQLRETGAHYVVAPCANCKKQLKELCTDNDLDMEVVGLHDLLVRAIDYPDFMKAPPKEEDEDNEKDEE